MAASSLLYEFCCPWNVRFLTAPSYIWQSCLWVAMWRQDNVVLTLTWHYWYLCWSCGTRQNRCFTLSFPSNGKIFTLELYVMTWQGDSVFYRLTLLASCTLCQRSSKFFFASSKAKHGNKLSCQLMRDT